MSSQKDFDSFLSNIEPSDSTVQYISSVQSNLRSYLRTHETYKDKYIDTFLSGSYAKHTSIRPTKGDSKRDVDIIIVTAYDKSKNSSEVLNEICDVLKSSSTYKSATVQHHSVGIELAEISVDIVPVIMDEDDSDLYLIGDSENGIWTITDPKGHKAWSTSVNKDNNEKYKPLVKIFKWWRHINCPDDIKYPKGITLEKIIADNLGDSSSLMEDFVVETMNNIVSSYIELCEAGDEIPKIEDPSDKVSGDLLEGYSYEDFYSFILKLSEHINLLNEEGEVNDTWRKILGNEFPKGTKNENNENVLACQNALHRIKMPWPMARDGVVFIAIQAKDKDGKIIQYVNNGQPLAKGCSLRFRAITGTKQPFKIKWQITNTGEEAEKACCLRGNFEDSDDGVCCKKENTQYSGSHSIQCFVIKNGMCIAKSEIVIINIK